MTPDELRALADALEPMAKAPRFEDFDVQGFCAWVRACADAKPVAWLHNGFVSTNHEAVQHDEMRNRQCGFKAKPVIALYTRPALAAPQAEPKREPPTDAILAACKGTKERAAKACEALAFPEANSHWSDGFNTAIKRCAAAIRALGRQHD